MKRINFELPENLIKKLEDVIEFKIYSGTELEYAIVILLQKCGYMREI